MTHEEFMRLDRLRWRRKTDRARRERQREARKTARANEARFIAGAYQLAVQHYSRLIYRANGGPLPMW